LKIKRVLNILIVLIIIILASAAVSASVLFNEVLPDGPAPEPDSEWIELYNNGTSPVYLTGWTLSEGAQSFTLPPSAIPAKGFVVLAYNGTYFNTTYTTSSQVIEYGNSSPFLVLQNSAAGNLVIRDSLYKLIDSFNFAIPPENTSWGRRYDGAVGSSPWVMFSSPTPGTYNNRKPTISSIPNQAFAEDSNLTVNFANYISDADNDTLNLTFSAVNNITITKNSLLVTFVPDQNFNGLRTLTVTASDSLTSETSNSFQLNITPVNDVPQVSIPLISFPEDTTTQINLDAYTTDPDTALSQINWTRTGGDSRISTTINPATHSITFSPQSDFCGLTSVLLRAQDTNVSYTDTNVNLNVSCVQDPPTVTLNSPGDTSITRATHALLQWTGNDADSDPLVYELFAGNSLANILPLFNTTNTTYNLTGLINGDTIYWKVIARDNQTTPVTSTTFSFDVVINSYPQIVSFTPNTTALTITKNNTQDFNVSLIDTDNETLNHIWRLDSSVVSNTTSVSNPNTVSSYAFDSTGIATGQHILNYTATDQYHQSVSQVWTITVRNPNQAPEFDGPIPYLTITEGSTGTLDLKQYFSDPDNDTLVFTNSRANDISVTYNNGIATVRPASGFFGVRSVIFNASDSYDTNSSNPVLIVVEKDNTLPQITTYSPTTTTLKTSENTKTTFSASASDQDSDPMIFEWSVNGQLKRKTTPHYNLREYPGYFLSYGYFNGQIIVGEDASLIETSAANKIVDSFQKMGILINDIYEPSEMKNSNQIVVGTPCTNSRIRDLLEISKSDCYTHFNTNEALIKAFNTNNYVALLVTGYSETEVSEAAQLLADFDQNQLSTDEVRFTTNTNFVPSNAIPNTGSDTFDFTAGQGGTFTIRLKVADSSGSIDIQEWTLTTADRPVADTFNGQTTDFSSLTENQLSKVNLTLERTSYGKIEFDNPINLSDVVDLDAYANIAQGLAAVDSVNVPELDAPATVTLYSINYNDPVIYQTSAYTSNPNDAGNYCSSCQFLSYNNSQLVFHVNGFSTYVVKEAVPAGLDLPESVQLGDDNSQRDQNISMQFTVSNPGTDKPVNGVTVSSSANSKYNVRFSADSSTYSSSLELNLATGESKTLYLKGHIPQKEDGGLHSIGYITADNGNFSDTAVLYVYPQNNLKVVSVEINDDSVSDGDTADIQPDSTLEIEVEVENTGSVDFEDVDIVATIYDLDGDDLEEDVEFELREGRKQEKTLTFSIPENLDEDGYDLNIEIEAEDDDGVLHAQELDFTLQTEKEDHKLKLDASLASETLECVRQTNLYTEIKNLGASDEDDIRLEIRNPELKIDLVKDSIEIDENDNFRTAFALDLDDVDAGNYVLAVSVYRDSHLSEEQTLTLEIKDCGESKEVIQKKTQSIQQEHQRLISEALAAHPPQQITKVKSKESSVNEYAVLALVITLILSAGLIVFAIGAAVIKGRKR